MRNRTMGAGRGTHLALTSTVLVHRGLMSLGWSLTAGMVARPVLRASPTSLGLMFGVFGRALTAERTKAQAPRVRQT